MPPAYGGIHSLGFFPQGFSPEKLQKPEKNQAGFETGSFPVRLFLLQNRFSGNGRRS
jgi:hypothetical protein